jgi:hypothetical protein
VSRVPFLLPFTPFNAFPLSYPNRYDSFVTDLQQSLSSYNIPSADKRKSLNWLDSIATTSAGGLLNRLDACCDPAVFSPVPEPSPSYFRNGVLKAFNTPPFRARNLSSSAQIKRSAPLLTISPSPLWPDLRPKQNRLNLMLFS